MLCAGPFLQGHVAAISSGGTSCPRCCAREGAVLTLSSFRHRSHSPAPVAEAKAKGKAKAKAKAKAAAAKPKAKAKAGPARGVIKAAMKADPKAKPKAGPALLQRDLSRCKTVLVRPLQPKNLQMLLPS